MKGSVRSFRQWDVGEFLDFAAELPALVIQCDQAIGGRRVFKSQELAIWAGIPVQ